MVSMQHRQAWMGLLVAGAALGCTRASDRGAAVLQPQAAQADAEVQARALPSRPSVILVSLDTLRADRLGCYGYGRPTSPFLDRIAREAALFEQAIAPASKTATSHMTMFSGMHPSVHGVRNYYGAEGQAAAPSLPLLAELLREQGYATAGFTGGGMMSGELGFERGFDLYDDSGGGADREFPRAATWLEQNLPRLEGQPFLLFVHTYQIHDPYTPPPEWQERFVDPAYAGKIDSTRVELPPNASEVWKTDPGFYERVQQRFWGGFDGRSAADMQHIRNLYDAGIAFTDSELARFWSRVEALGIADEVLLVVTSDHGEEFGEHGGLSHQTLYQEILHVPLLVRWPGVVDAGRRIARPVQGADLMPALLEACGIALETEVQGRSWLRDALGGPGEADETWSELGTPRNEKAALLWGRYKLIGDRNTRKGEFYDLRSDAAERFNLVENFLELAVHLTQRMEAQDKRNLQLAPRYAPTTVQMSAEAMGLMNALGYTGEDEGGAAAALRNTPKPAASGQE